MYFKIQNTKIYNYELQGAFTFYLYPSIPLQHYLMGMIKGTLGALSHIIFQSVIYKIGK